jgi:trigger factor
MEVISFNENESCKFEVQCEFNSEEILSKKDEVLKIFKSAPVPGCRPGKAPMSSIRLYYCKQIDESLKRALAEDAFHNTIFEKQLRPHGPPTFHSSLLSNEKFVCNFDITAKPNFELKDYLGLEVPKPAAKTTVAEVAEKTLNELRLKAGTTQPFTDGDFVQNGDNVILNYEGFVGEERVENLCQQATTLTIGNSQFKDFDPNLVGMVVGEKKEFDILVPEGGLPSIAGKTVHFKVELMGASKNTPAALDDELAKRYGKKNFDEFRLTVNEMAFSKVENENKAMRNNAITSKLVEDTKIDVPSWMTLSEAKYLVSKSQVEWEKLEDIDKLKYMEVAEKNVKLSLILDKLREQEPEAQLSDQEVFEVVKRHIMASVPKDSVDSYMTEINKNGYLQILFSRVRDEYTIDFLVKNTTFVE